MWDRIFIGLAVLRGPYEEISFHVINHFVRVYRIVILGLRLIRYCRNHTAKSRIEGQTFIGLGTPFRLLVLAVPRQELAHILPFEVKVYADRIQHLGLLLLAAGDVAPSHLSDEFHWCSS